MKRQQIPKVVGKQINTSQSSNRKVSPAKLPPQSSQSKKQVDSKPKPAVTRAPVESSKAKPPNILPRSNQSSSQSDVSQSSTKSTQKTNQIPAISREYDRMRLRLQELKEQLAQIEAKWSTTISEAENRYQSSIAQSTKQHELKLKQIEQSFNSQASSSRNATMEKQINEMKIRADNLQQEGKSNESQQLLKQAKELEMQLKGGESYFTMRELEARKQPMIKAHQVKMAQMKEHHEGEMRKFEQNKKIEIDPIASEIARLEKRLHGDAAKAARSPLCRKD